MDKKIYINIKSLIGVGNSNDMLRGSALNELISIDDAFLLTCFGKIEDFGSMKDLDALVLESGYEIIDVNGRIIFPCWVDSHTHLVHAASREDEFIAKLKGASYEEIAGMGGGILNSAKKIEEISEEELYNISLLKLKTAISNGTGAMEIKSGYGLSVHGEIKMLRVIKELKKQSSIPIKASFLAAHAYPLKYRDDHQAYIKIIINEMMPLIAKESLADYVDVFCEKGFFSAEETIQVCLAAKEFGLKPKLHVNQLNSIGGIEAGIKVAALSLDHLETINVEDIKLLGSFNGISCLLPTASFFLRMQYPPARALIDANAAIAIASDFNPGSSPSSNMNFVAALSAIQMKLLPAEVLNAGTINAANAIELQTDLGNIQRGKLANFIVTKPITSLAYFLYDFACSHIQEVIINGARVASHS